MQHLINKVYLINILLLLLTSYKQGLDATSVIRRSSVSTWERKMLSNIPEHEVT